VSQTLFDQYKTALRRGHMAALAGELEEALAAYDVAARLVPERALPLASRGTVLHRLDRWSEAAAAFDQALQLAPDDETALRARANARDERGLRSDAAADFERLAFVLDVAGRVALAAEAARRAADLEPTGARAALAERLGAAASRLGDLQGAASAGGQPFAEQSAEFDVTGQVPGDAGPASEDAAEPATLAQLEVDGAPAREAMHDDPWSAALDARRLAGLHGEGRSAGDSTPLPDEDTAATSAGAYDALEALRAEMDAVEGDPAQLAAGAGSAVASGADDQGSAATEAGRAASTDGAEGSEPAAEPAEPDAGDAAAGEATDGTWPGIDLPSPPPPPIEGPPPEPEDLLSEAALVLESGEVEAARDLMLTAIRVHREAGRIDAALDIALNVLSIAPGDPRVHLAIANLQLDRGWTGVATEKIDLLVRLTSLTGDTQAEADVHGLASERLRDDPAPSTAGG
jgi:tetratricopeptide (TPR) repeat protein